MSSARLPVCLPACLCACLRVCVPACLCVCLSVFLPACLSVCLPACLSVCLPACLCSCLPACLPVCVPVCQCACLPMCLPARLSACLPACLTTRNKVICKQNKLPPQISTAPVAVIVPQVWRLGRPHFHSSGHQPTPDRPYPLRRYRFPINAFLSQLQHRYFGYSQLQHRKTAVNLSYNIAILFFCFYSQLHRHFWLLPVTTSPSWLLPVATP